MTYSNGVVAVVGQINTKLRRLPDWMRPYVLALTALTGLSLLAALVLQTVGARAIVVVSLLGDLAFLGSAWLGYGPGILVCFLITFVVPPLLAPEKPVNTDPGRIGILLLLSLVISKIAASKRRSEALLRQASETLEARVAERTRELRDSESRYRLLFENNPQAMWVYDQDTLAFLTVNDTAAGTYGYTRQEFLSMTLRDIRPEEDVAKLLEATAVPTLEFHQEGPWRHRKKNGQIISVEINEHPILFDGRRGCLVMATDITERLKLEEQFRQSQRMESIGRLAGGVAHDFNNLLTVINGYAEMLLSGVSEGGSASMELREIRAAGERAADLTRQLLAFSRQQVIQLSAIDINSVVREMEIFLRRLIGEDVEVIMRLTPELGVVEADPGQIHQIVMNLAVNSRDAMPEGGTLLIETSNVVLGEGYLAEHRQVPPGAYVMLAVTDTGQGMSPEVRARIFEPFYTTKELGKGTGLGLATVYGMVKRAGGWIWVYSEPNRGTTFKVYLPQTDQPVSTASPAVLVRLEGNETIVVVEDEAEVRTLAVAGLAHYGYAAYGFSTGKEAFAFCQDFNGEIHVLVTDVIMPDMNGREVARRVAQLKPEARILFVSGYTTNVIVHEGVLDPDVEYLQKPFTPDSLARKIRQILTTS